MGEGGDSQSLRHDAGAESRGLGCPAHDERRALFPQCPVRAGDGVSSGDWRR